MKLIDLIIGLKEVLNNNDNRLKSVYEGAIKSVTSLVDDDVKLLCKTTNRTVTEVGQLDIHDFYIEVNLCKKLKAYVLYN